MFYKRRHTHLLFLVFVFSMCSYAKYMQLAGSGLVIGVLQLLVEQTQQMCEMRKEIYLSPISMRSWPSLSCKLQLGIYAFEK